MPVVETTSTGEELGEAWPRAGQPIRCTTHFVPLAPARSKHSAKPPQSARPALELRPVATSLKIAPGRARTCFEILLRNSALRRIPFSGHLHRSFQLHSLQHRTCACRTPAHIGPTTLRPQNSRVRHRDEGLQAACARFHTPCRAPSLLASKSIRSALRARDSRDITVPTGIDSVSEISW